MKIREEWDRSAPVVGCLIFVAINLLVGLIKWYRGEGPGVFIVLVLFYVTTYCALAGVAALQQKSRKKRRALIRAARDQ